MGRRTLGHPKFFVQADGEPQFSAPGWSLGWNALSLRLQSNTFPRLFTGFDGWYRRLRFVVFLNLFDHCVHYVCLVGDLSFEWLRQEW